MTEERTKRKKMRRGVIALMVCGLIGMLPAGCAEADCIDRLIRQYLVLRLAWNAKLLRDLVKSGRIIVTDCGQFCAQFGTTFDGFLVIVGNHAGA